MLSDHQNVFRVYMQESPAYTYYIILYKYMYIRYFGVDKDGNRLQALIEFYISH